MNFSQVVPKVKHFVKSSDHSLLTSGVTTKKNKLTSRTTLVSGVKIKEFYENTVGKEAFEIQKETKPKEEKGPIIVKPKTQKAPFNVNLLMKAVESGNVEDVLLLLKGNEESVNCKDQFGWTPLMTACCAGNLSVVEQLLKWKPDVTVRDRRGLNCRDLAYKRGYHSIVNALDCYLQNLCKPSMKYVQQNTSNEQAENRCFYCEDCKQNIQNVSVKKHLSSTVHNFNSSCKRRMPTFYGIPESNKGFQILVKSGWDKEGGLGPSGEGHKYPPKTILKQDRTGLGAKQYKARVTHSLGETTQKLRQIRTGKRDLKSERRKEQRLNRELRRMLS